MTAVHVTQRDEGREADIDEGSDADDDDGGDDVDEDGDFLGGLDAGHMSDDED